MNLYSMHVGRGVIAKYGRYIDDGFDVLNISVMQVKELKRALNEWNTESIVQATCRTT